MTSNTLKTNYLQSSLFPSGQTVSKSSKNVVGFNVETLKTETSLLPGYRTKLFVITRNKHSEIEEPQIVEKYEDVPFNSSLSILLFFKKDVSDDNLIEIMSDQVTEFIHTFVTTESSNDIPFFEESLLQNNLINEYDPINISSLKTINVDDPLIVNFTIITIFYDCNTTGSKFSYYCHSDEEVPEDYDDKVMNENGGCWFFACPKIFDIESGDVHESYDPEIIAKNLMKKVENSSTPGRYLLKEMVEKSKVKEYTNLGSATGHSPSQASTTSDLYTEHVKRIGDKPDSSINSFESVKNVLKKLSNIYKDVKTGVNIDSSSRKAVDMFKKTSKEQQLLKASAGTNFKLSFSSFPNFLSDVPTMAFDEVEKYDANFFVTITSTDFSSIAKSMNLSAISKDEKRGILIALVKRFVEMIFELYNTQEITDEQYEDIFLNGNVSSSSSKTLIGKNEFNESSTKINTLKNLASMKSNSLKPNIKSSSGINSMSNNFGFQNKIASRGLKTKTINQISLEELKFQNIAKKENSYDCKISEISFSEDNLTLAEIFLSFSPDVNVLMPFKLSGYTPASMITYQGKSFNSAFNLLVKYLDENNICVTCLPNFTSNTAFVKINDISLSDGFDKISFENDSYGSKKLVLDDKSHEFTVNEFLEIYPCIDDDETDYDGMNENEIIESYSLKIFEKMKDGFNISSLKITDNVSVDKTEVVKTDSSTPNKSILAKLKRVNKLTSLPAKIGSSISPQVSTATTPISDPGENDSVTSETKQSKFKSSLAFKKLNESKGEKITSGGKLSGKMALLNKNRGTLSDSNEKQINDESSGEVKSSIASKIPLSKLSSKTNNKPPATGKSKTSTRKIPLGKKTIINEDSDPESDDEDDDDDDSGSKRKIVIGFDQAAEESDNENNNLFGKDDEESDEEESDEESDEEIDEDNLIVLNGIDI